jgi:hypothetical protein
LHPTQLIESKKISTLLLLVQFENPLGKISTTRILKEKVSH